MTNYTEAEQLLKELTEALDGAFISCWQSTHAWQNQLEAAQEYLYKKELTPTTEDKEFWKTYWRGND